MDKSTTPPARQHVPTDQAGADGLIFSIAQIIDHPSVYMSGPSRNAIRIASEIVKHHRADLAAPSAPAEVERLRGKLRDECNLGLATLERAEKAEAERDAWKANANTLAEAAKRLKQEAEIEGKAPEAGWDCWIIVADVALAAHAKLKGEV